jgi:type III pantothenate kinase
MLLAVDIGNSSIKFGIFDRISLVHKFSVATKLDYTANELIFDRFHVLDETFIQLKFTSAIVVSVVPELNDVIAEVCFELFKVRAVFVDHTLDLGMQIDYDPPSSLGADRLVSAFSAKELYGPPAIVCSFGTATTIDLVDAKGTFRGGMITPGMGTMAASLHSRTAKLPYVHIQRPEGVVQRSTDGAIMSGVYNGHAAMASGLIELVRAEYYAANPGSSPIKVIATGGFAGLLSRDVESFDLVDENLTLSGLRLVAIRIGHPV